MHALIDVRILRLLRMFRLLKLTAYVSEFGALYQALRASRRKIVVFLSFVLLVVMVMGTLMYVVEGPANGLHQHPGRRVLGHHDDDHGGLRRHHAEDRPGPLHRRLMMLMGWGTLAVPTGIVSAELMAQRDAARTDHAHLPRMPERRPCARREVLPRLRRAAAALAA